MAYAIGIDLGTTNSGVAVYRQGVPKTLDIDGHIAMPSVVSFREDRTVLIGQSAKARMLIDPESTVSSSKRSIGDRTKFYNVNGKTLSPVNIASMVLKRLVESAQSALGEEIKDVVITVPAYFTEAQKEDTKHAGEAAGLHVLRLIPEPTAAAIAYGLDKEKSQRIMVYDLGGGTFDVSILEVEGNSFTVKAVGGDVHLGGDDFDRVIITWAAEQFKRQTGIDVLGTRGREGKVAQQRLKDAAENAKIELAESDKAFLNLPDCLGHPLSLELSLSQYNQLITPFIERTVDCVRAVLHDAQLTPDHIDRVILVGGSTKNKIVAEVLRKHVKDPYIADRVDEVVAHGAAIVAANLFLPEEETRPIEISDVTAHSLGIDMINPDNRTQFFHAILPRQASYPCREGLLAFTVDPFDEMVKMRVFRGEDADPEKNTCLGEIELPISPPQEESVPIAAIFELDADGIIRFTAVQLPPTQQISAIKEFADAHDGKLNLAEVDALVRSGQAKTKTVQIKTG